MSEVDRMGDIAREELLHRWALDVHYELKAGGYRDVGELQLADTKEALREVLARHIDHHLGAVEARAIMRDLLTEAVRQDYGTPGWRARAIKAGCLLSDDVEKILEDDEELKR